MTQFTILHRGVPLGVAFTPPESEGDDPNPFALNMMEFEPAAAYESVRPLARLAAASFFGGLFGPIVDLEAADAALPAAKALWAELELADTVGNPVAGRVVWFLENTFGGQVSYWVDVELDDASADMRARAPMPPRRAQSYNQLRPNA